MYWLTTLVKKDFLLFLIFTYIYILVLNCPTLHTINIIVDCRLFLMASRSNNCFYHLSLNGFRTWLVSGHKFGLTIYNGTDSIGGRMWPNNKHTLEARSGEGNGTPLQYSGLENPMDESLVGCSPWGGEESDTTEQFHFHFPLSCIGEGNGNPLQCSCLENPRDRGAWWAAVYGVAQSQTRLKGLSSSSSTKRIIATIKYTLNLLKKMENIMWHVGLNFTYIQ